MSQCSTIQNKNAVCANIYSIIDTSIKRPLSGQSTYKVKCCLLDMDIALVILRLPITSGISGKGM